MNQPSSKPTPATVERYSPWLIDWFQWYLRRYVPKHFHAVGLAKQSLPEINDNEPLIVYLNHASWWDPLVCLMVAKHSFPTRRVFAPFDAAALARYPMFEKLGFFGVEQETRRGAAEFLRTAAGVLNAPNAGLWITPEGRFCDPRDSQAEFEPGLAHVVSKLASQSAGKGVVIPLAIEYPFWEERLPEILIRFGEPMRVSDFADYAKEGWQMLLTERMRTAQQELAELSIARDSRAFEVLLGGAAGVGGFYDTMRRAFATLTGQTYQPNHGDKFSQQ